jgi:alcohol dehydrogenase YqhD (iron-dependent ADH family)
MENFRFFNSTAIIFGRDTEKLVGAETKKRGKRVLVHFGGGSIKKSGLYDRVVGSLRESGIAFFELGGVKPNPRLSLVHEGVDLCRKNNVDFILAVGGGSVIDSAKAIALGATNTGDVWDFYMGKAAPTEALPIGCVLTIPAAGSESSQSSVITNEEGKLKRFCDTEILRPSFAIMNPELSFTLPPYQTACGASDIMAHVMERYFTNSRHVELTDRLCESVLKTVIENAPIALGDPENYDARAEIMWAGAIAHNDLLGTGRIGDWASHMIEHELSAINDVAHGAGLAIVFPAWMKYVCNHDIRSFVRFAVRVWNVDEDFHDPEKTAWEGIRRLENFFESIGLPTRLSEIGIVEKDFDMIAEKCRRFDGDTVGNFVRLDGKAIKKILEIAR